VGTGIPVSGRFREVALKTIRGWKYVR